ncbi:unnamed protein product [Blepharisma stoltei]|uniref:Calponin-homology (CH) domain-containing protein n=1 Tax=Blepharisma stoltei TaxID=1481888 RepID=A0AAU9KE31_9CILI|nr:unnamed protein product [Blepharisma stoltei]
MSVLWTPKTLTSKSLTKKKDQKDIRLTKSEPLEIFPPEIVFKDIEPDQTYEVTVSVRNLCSVVRRIRFIPPKTSKFLAEYETLGAIAGGTQTNIVISFETDHVADFHDEMTIISEDSTYTLLLHAYQPSPEIAFEPFINLGLTSVYKSKSTLILFRNEGSRQGKISLNYDKNISPELVIEPENFTLDPRNEIDIKFTYTPREVGVFRCPVEVNVEGQEKIRHIDVNGTCVEHQMSIVAANVDKLNSDSDIGLGNNMAVTTNLNFGHMYHGEMKSLDSYLVNNGPVKVHFSIRFILGSEEEAESDQLVYTPQEQAKQELKRVMKAEPSHGIVDAYSQLHILFTCHSKVLDKVKGHSSNMMENGNAASGDMNASYIVDNMINYFYTAIFNFQELDSKLPLQLQATAVIPNIKVSQNAVFFPQCAVNDRRDVLVKIENMNDELSVDFSFNQVSQFSVDPAKGVLLPLQSKSINFSFIPKNLGIFHSVMTLHFIKEAYKVPIHLYGKSTGISEKGKEIRGPESTVKDFEPARKYVSESDLANMHKTKVKTEGDTLKTDYSLQMDQAILQDFVKKQYVDFLRTQRKERLAKEKQNELQRTGKIVPLTKEEMEKDPDLGISRDLLKEPMLSLPNASDQLFVNKQIGLYENSHSNDNMHDPDRAIKNVRKKAIDRKKFKEVPYSLTPTKQVEIRECSKKLSAEELQFISAGPKNLDFGKVVMNSPSFKWFSIANDLKHNIFVELVSAVSEINTMEPNSLVIPPGLKGGFKLGLLSSRAQELEGIVTYKINGEHTFNFRIIAKVEPAELRISKNYLKFVFDDDNMEESLCEKLFVENGCNADTRFAWVVPPNSNFEVEPLEDLVEAGKTRPVIVKFTPSIGANRNDEENLVMKVQNGEKCTLRCKGEFTEAKCQFLQKQLDFEVVAVGIKHEKSVTIKNLLRSTAIYHIKKCPTEITVTPTRGKISGDGRANLKIEFCSFEEQELHGELEVLIRGGKPLVLSIHASAIIPKVYIQEPEIDFGGVTYKCSAYRKFTVVNESPIACVLYISLQEHPEFEVSLPADHLGEGECESTVLMGAASDRGNPFVLRDEHDELEDIKMEAGMQEEDDSEEEEEEVARTFRLNLHPSTSITLQLKFTPSDTETYLFDLPVMMAGVNETLKSLTRPVSGEGLQPKFLIEPAIVDFKKKYITAGEKSFPDYKDVIFSNPDIYPLRWKLDTSTIDSTKIFTIRPLEGYLEPAASVTVRASFNPNQAIDYEEKINLFIDNSTEPYLTLTLRGEGSIPRISFDRRYVILPITPLGISSKSIFKINNEGYQNVELKYRLPKDAGRIPLQLNFPDGQTLGSTKQKIPVEVIFNSDRALSFTANLDFFDNEGNKFTIAISGTADNCLFTSFPFIQSHQEDIRFNVDENGAMKLEFEEVSDGDEASGRWGTGGPAGAPRTSAASSVYSRSAKSIVGYQPVPQFLLEKGLDHLNRWLNHSVLSSTINKFPDDFVNQHGAPLYELVFALSGKYPPGQVKNPNSLAPKELARQLFKQYDDLIEYLKRNGAMLNTLRPEFLLSQNDFARFLKSTPLELQLRPKQIQHRWPYLSMDSWTTLIFQIVKLYLLNRVTPKSFKNLPGMNPEEANIDAGMTSSNIYSVSECILLKWLSYHYECIHPHTPKKISNFESDLSDGTVISSVIQSHIGNVKALGNIKVNPNSEEQRSQNCEKVIAGLSEIGLPTHFTANDLVRPSAREALLFVLQLYQGLPHYIPKCKIIFSCPLSEKIVKNIELTNPSNKSVNYWVRIEGSSDYTFEAQESITLPSKSTVQFPVTFQSRVTVPVQKAKLSFTNRTTDGGAQGAALVFELISDVKAPINVMQIDFETPLYKLFNKEVEIKNNYSQEAEFVIQLNPIEDAPKKPPANKKKGPPEPPPLQFPPAFYIKNEKVKVKKNSVSFIGVQFLPFEMKTHKAELILCDEKVGEIHYLLVANVSMPESQLITMKQEMGDSMQVVVPLKSKNEQLEFAKSKCRERYQASHKTRERDTLNEIFKKLHTEDTNVYDIVLSSPFFGGPNTISLTEFSKSKGGKGGLDTSQVSDVSKQEISLQRSKKTPSRSSHTSQAPAGNSSSGQDAQNKLQLSFSPKTPGEYPCFVTLTSTRKTDIRIYEIVVAVKPKKNVVTLEMTAPARGEVKQDIPIINNSDKDWPVKVSLTQDAKEFSVSKDFVVRRKSTGYCPLVFKPIWTCDVKGKLLLDIPLTGDLYEFNLRGIGEEPNAEEHMTIDCKVKETYYQLIPIMNPNDFPVVYKVESDLVIASGDPQIQVPAKTKGQYELQVKPIQSGMYSGAITFYDNQGKFYWYTLEVRAQEPEPEDEKILMTQCRKAVELKLTVYNPYPENTTFEVNIQGHGLMGDNMFYVAAKELGTYELLYSPLLPGESYGTISFVSEKTGEFWYKLKLIALPPEPFELEIFECELGKSETQHIALENPTNEEVILDYSCSNPLNFELVPERIILPPYETIEATVKYSPSTLKHVETGEIKLSSKALGDWIFKLRGKGRPPTLMEPLEIAATIGETSSTQITFKNPFRENITISIALEASENVFQLLVRKNKYAIGPLGSLLIPVAFIPTSMDEHTAVLLVSITDELTWRYPLKGITENASTRIDYSFKTKCRTSLEMPLNIVLNDLVDLTEEENFTNEINVIDQAVKHFVDKSLQIETHKNIISSPAEALEFSVKFEPLRPFKTQVELLIYKGSGGRWKYNIMLEALDPDIDDTINIESQINKTTSIAFKLTNQFKAFAEFEAFFTPESDSCFAIQPNQGILEPYGREGTTFIVSFTPVEYGAPKVGKLVIQTEDMMWTYLVKGSHPRYQPPEASGGRIDNRLQRSIQPQQSSKKNFIKKNIKGLSPTRSKMESSMKSLSPTRKAPSQQRITEI